MMTDFVELAGASAAHLRRVVDRVADEVRLVGAGGNSDAKEAGTVLRRMARKARMARRELLIGAEDFGQEWAELVLDRRPVSLDLQLAHVQQFLVVAEAGLELVQAVRALHADFVAAGVPEEPAAELRQAEQLYHDVSSQASELAGRLNQPWRPKDHARFAETVRADRPKRFYTQDEAHNYFRPQQG